MVIDIIPEHGRVGGHEAADHACTNLGVESSQVNRTEAAQRKAETTYPVRVYLGPGQQVIDGAHVVPEKNARPGHSAHKQSFGRQAFVFMAELVGSCDELVRTSL